ncbi:hypothetical protein [Namhaeicola litoreus]|uniref:Fibronectin type III-like domain-containing protein n=1 Tax=Namhaeicola litoreus TaxID=1052145 RepID=A0ABW3Y3C3_9FLAO
MVNFGRNAGVKTIFKMTVYGVDEFIWEDSWLIKKGEYKIYIDARKVIWQRYSMNISVSGYDVV